MLLMLLLHLAIGTLSMRTIPSEGFDWAAPWYSMRDYKILHLHDDVIDSGINTQ